MVEARTVTDDDMDFLGSTRRDLIDKYSIGFLAQTIGVEKFASIPINFNCSEHVAPFEAPVYRGNHPSSNQ